DALAVAVRQTPAELNGEVERLRQVARLALLDPAGKTAAGAIFEKEVGGALQLAHVPGGGDVRVQAEVNPRLRLAAEGLQAGSADFLQFLHGEIEMPFLVPDVPDGAER